MQLGPEGSPSAGQRVPPHGTSGLWDRESGKNVENKNVTFFSWVTPAKRKKRFFLQAPCTSQAPFHAPIRGGYRGGARLSKMACSDTTQRLQVSLFGPKSPRSRGRKTLFCVSTKHEQLEQLHFCLCSKRPRKKKKQFGRGIFFVDLRSRNFPLEGGWRLSRTQTPNQT